MERPQGQVIIEKEVPCSMRDGVTLYSDVYRPTAEGRHPVLLLRTPYDKEDIALGIGVQVHPVHAASRGYVAIVQDVRGRYSSQGRFNVFFDEIQDGYDTVEWAANLPYSTGKVGMFGGSYTGLTQILAAKSGPKHLIAVSPRETGSNYFDGWAYQGGAFMLGFNVLWSVVLAMNEVNRMRLPEARRRAVVEELAAAFDDLKETCSPISLESIDVFRKHGVAQYFYDWVQHPTYDSFWKKIDAESNYQGIDVAGLHLCGWYDIFLKGSIRNYLGFGEKDRKEGRRSRQKLVIGPWVHGTDMPNKVGDWNSGYLSQGSALGLEAMQFRWFDHWLKGQENGVMDEPPVLIYVMGENRWRAEREWPLTRAKYVNFYLHSNGYANTMNGDGALDVGTPLDEPADTYVYDPDDPVPTLGGGTTGSGPAALPPGVFDQRPNENRSDVLVYSGQILERDTEVTGPVEAHLWINSSEVDTDFTGKLVDVHPDGYARNLCDGILRARFRESLESPRLMEPGKIYELRIDLVATSNLFRKGHRIRFEIASSNFPKYDRNPNTGHVESKGGRKRAIQTVYHRQMQPSYVILPIVPRD